MSNGISNAFRDIGRAIRINFDNNLFAATLIVTYTAIDTMAFLSMPENQREVRKPDFINWVESYMQTDSNQPYQYQGIDLYGARCGIIHRYGATSRLSDSSSCKVFNYHNGSEHIYNPEIHEDLVAISIQRFINDFFRAMRKFLRDALRNESLRQRVENRINHLFIISEV